ncbi:MAG: TnsA endonuclease N-terminal domain-containing protein, partial [Nitrospiraceae bacterium]
MRGRPVVPVPKHERGKGRKSDYVASIQTGDKVSRGQRSRILSDKLGRDVVCLSIGEKRVYVVLEWSLPVTDIREQYPLYPIEGTIAIAQQLGVRPCALNLQGKPMTTDFLITCREGLTEREVAISYKEVRELADPRTLELAEIERVFHARRGTVWGFVTDLDLPLIVVTNLDFLTDYYALENLAPLT